MLLCKKMSFSNIVVTGANRGIGYQYVTYLLAQSPAPKNVIATTRKPSEELNKLKSANSNLHIVTYDATNYKSYPDFVEQVSKIVGPDGIDLLINNAGIYVSGNLETVKAEDVLRNIEVNAVAPLELTRALLPLLKVSSTANKRKTVIANISSMAGSIGDNTSGSAVISIPYRSSKAALNMITRSLAVDLKETGIIVLAIHPGWVKTDMGGERAPLTPLASVSGISEFLAKVSSEQSGTFVNHQGKELPW